MSDYVNTLECPLGCKAQGDKPIAATLRGWKKHMTRQHGKWTEEQVRALEGISPPSANPEKGRDLFLSEVDETTDTPAVPTEKVVSIDAEAEARKTVDLKTDAMGKKFNAKLNRMKKAVAEKLPQALGKAVEDKGPEWLLDKDDTEILSESIENCFDILDIDFKITPYSATLTNPLWVLILPLLACILVFAPKAAKAARKEQNENPASSNSPD